MQLVIHFEVDTGGVEYTEAGRSRGQLVGSDRQRQDSEGPVCGRRRLLGEIGLDIGYLYTRAGNHGLRAVAYYPRDRSRYVSAQDG